MTIRTLRWVLSIAIEYKHISENPATGRRRRLTVPPSRPVHLDSPQQVEALIDAAAELDHDIAHRSFDRKPIVATLVLAGPRAHEICQMLWRDVDLANGRIMIRRSKTQAGLREIRMLPLLRDILASYKVNSYRSGPEDLVFPTATQERIQSR